MALYILTKDRDDISSLFRELQKVREQQETVREEALKAKKSWFFGKKPEVPKIPIEDDEKIYRPIHALPSQLKNHMLSYNLTNSLLGSLKMSDLAQIYESRKERLTLYKICYLASLNFNNGGSSVPKILGEIRSALDLDTDLQCLSIGDEASRKLGLISYANSLKDHAASSCIALVAKISMACDNKICEKERNRLSDIVNILGPFRSSQNCADPFGWGIRVKL